MICFNTEIVCEREENPVGVRVKNIVLYYVKLVAIRIFNLKFNLRLFITAIQQLQKFREPISLYFSSNLSRFFPLVEWYF